MEQTASSEVTEEVQELKSKGNTAYGAGNYAEAIQYFTQAIHLDGTNGTLFCNRSMAHSSLLQWEDALSDAKMAVRLSPKYEKAYFRLVKALIQLDRLREARMCLIIGFNDCGDAKHLKALEKEIFDITGIPVRPKPHDFDTLEELGDGNFSKIYKTLHKPTGKIYAIKTIEKMTVDRMKRRHPNIHNEILIEKRTLNKLDHPNIVTLFATFQDYGTLYYQMEFLEGGEVWSFLQDEKTKASVGCYPSLAKFWIAEAINALEYMHKHGIVHRDVKPENMILTSQGHLKFVDFGTCKDLISTDLNGQEFVGTAEYMSPEVVESKPSGPETDLWSLGVVIYQMMVGYTPFLASSPYLSFLRIKRGFLRLPSFLDDATAEIISLLIHKDQKERFRNAAEKAPATTPAATDDDTAAKPKPSFSYDKLRNLAFFKQDPNFVFPNPFAEDPDSPAAAAVRVPTLSEIALRAVGQACLVVAEKIAVNGGSRVGLDQWIQDFTLTKLSLPQRSHLLHYLNRRGDAHSPAVYRLFWTSVVDARCIRSEWTEREILGFNRHTQGRYATPFSFAYIADPLFGSTAAASSVSEGSSPTGAGPGCESQERNMKAIVSALNKLRPKFVVMSGNFISTPMDLTGDAHIARNELFRRTATRVSETIPVFFVPGDNDLGSIPPFALFPLMLFLPFAPPDLIPTPESIARYHRNFGCDFYGFWFGGIRFLIINSTLMLYPQNVPDHARYQDVWLEEELEQCKLCALQVVIFSHHPWILPEQEQGQGQEEDEELKEGESHRVMTKTLRDKWLPKMRHQKIKYLFAAKLRSSSSCSPSAGQVVKTFKAIKKPQSGRVTIVDKVSPEQTETKGEEELKEKMKSVSISEETVATTTVEDDGSSPITPSADWKELPAGTSEAPDDTDTDEDNDGDKDSKDDNGPFAPDLKYFGPDHISTPAVGTMAEDSEVIRIIEISDEEDIRQSSYSLSTLPTKLTF